MRLTTIGQHDDGLSLLAKRSPLELSPLSQNHNSDIEQPIRSLTPILFLLDHSHLLSDFVMTPIPPVLVRGAGVLHDPLLRGAHPTRAAIRRDQVGVRAEAELGR